ncbi:MAG: lantibiotic modifying enzyme, partial [Salibacteraceae bacterium]
MKNLLSLIIISISFISTAQKFEIVDKEKMMNLEPGTFEYVIMGREEKRVIEEKSNFLIDFVRLDMTDNVDSVIVTLGKKTLKMKALSPFMINGMDASKTLKVEMYKDGSIVDF